VAVVDHLLAHFLRDVADELVLVLSDSVQQVKGIVLTQVPMELGGRAQADEYF